ncbi:hypothetical protein KP509_05G068800 [Ceratopteris richardii]|nr:hypothetical protein KP509_05G068800 [Ceratopteris richardii]
MMSCSRSYLEDQLLGLALVPLDDIMGAGKITCDYPLTSTELFHAPAGIVRLSLRFYKRSLEPLLPDIILSDGRKPAAENGTSSCPVAHQEKGSSEAVDYSSIEFPDLQVASEDQELVSMYMDMVTTDPQTDEDPDNADGTQRRSMIEGAPRENYTDQKKVLKNAPLRQTHVISGASATELTMSDSQGECGMTSKTMKEKNVKRIGGSDHAPYRSNVAEDMELLPSTNVSHQLDVKGSVSNEQMTDIKESKLSASNKAGSPGMSTSASSGGGHSSSDEKSLGSADRHTSLPSNSSGPPPVVSISLDTEEPVVQQQIVDMYMKSMQQFTESLAKMKLPFDMDSTKSQEENCSNDLNGSQKETETSTASRSEPTTKDATHARRVFYGSRAFF